MGLTARQLKQLRGLAHSLKPVVITGQHGLTDAVLKEIEIALDHHELIKVRMRAEREARTAYSERIIATTGATQVLSVGQNLTLYRPNRNNPKIELD